MSGTEGPALSPDHLADGGEAEGRTHIKDKTARGLHWEIGNGLGAVAQVAVIRVGGLADDAMAHSVVAGEFLAENGFAGEISAGRRAGRDRGGGVCGPRISRFPSPLLPPGGPEPRQKKQRTNRGKTPLVRTRVRQ